MQKGSAIKCCASFGRQTARRLAGKGAAAVCAPAAVGVDDDLAAGEAGVRVRAADVERAARIEVEPRVDVQLERNDRAHDEPLEFLAQLLERHVFAVCKRRALLIARCAPKRTLRRDDDRVNALRHARALLVSVLDCHLKLVRRFS